MGSTASHSELAAFDEPRIKRQIRKLIRSKKDLGFEIICYSSSFCSICASPRPQTVIKPKGTPGVQKLLTGSVDERQQP